MSDLVTLLLVASLVLTALCGAAIVVLRLDDRRRRVSRRTETVIVAYKKAVAPTEQVARLSLTVPVVSLQRRVQAFIGMDPDRRDAYPARWWIVLPGALLPGRVVVWLMHGLFGWYAWVLMPLTWLWLVRGVYRGSDLKRVNKLLRQFPDALSMIVRAVRVGIPVTEAMRGVAKDSDQPTALEFQRLHDQVGIGTPLEDALREMAARNKLPEYRFFATALSLQAQTGGGLTETLEILAEVIRKRVALKSRGYALAAEARTSALVLTALPILAGLALAVINPDYIGLLMVEGSGQTLFGIAVLWLALGTLVMRSLIRRSLS